MTKLTDQELQALRVVYRLDPKFYWNQCHELISSNKHPRPYCLKVSGSKMNGLTVMCTLNHGHQGCHVDGILLYHFHINNLEEVAWND